MKNFTVAEKATRKIQTFWKKKSFFTQFVCLLDATAFEINQGFFNKLSKGFYKLKNIRLAT